jgi:hypothetical protein
VAIELADFIGQLRQELTAALRSGEEEELRFELGPVELELTFAVDKGLNPGAKVKFWVMELGADATMSSGITQRIKLLLDPRLEGMSDRRPLISGPEGTGER